MPLVVPFGFASAALIFNSASGTQPFVTTIGVNMGGWVGSNVDLANYVMDSYGDTMAIHMATSITLVSCSLYVGPSPGSGSVDSNIAPVPGTRTGAQEPIAMAAIARKVTNQLGRKGRGRMFLPGVLTDADVQDDGSISTSRITPLDTALEAFRQRLDNPTVPGDLLPVLLHSSASTPPTEITGLRVQRLVGWVRGRIR